MATAKKKPAPAKTRARSPAQETAPARPKRTNRKLAGKPVRTKKQAAKPAIAEKSSKTSAPIPAKPAGAAPAHDLPELEARFCVEYLVDLNGTQAYLRCKPSVKKTTAGVEACRFLSKPRVQQEIARLKAERLVRTTISADAAVQRAWDIMNADSRELMEYRVGCCRYCWGFQHRYQRTDAKLDEDREKFETGKALASEKTQAKMGEFQMMGGGGFDIRRSPNPDCPECGGEGTGRHVLKDTRHLSPQAAMLLAGVETTKEGGIKLRTHNQQVAHDQINRHLGIYNDKVQLTLPVAVIKDMTGRKPV